MTFSDFHEMTLGQLLSIQAERFGERPYLTQGDVTLTYTLVEARANRLAGGLQGLGLQSGDRLAVLLPNAAEYALTIFAAAKAGLILVPINIRRSAEEIQARLANTQARVVVTFGDAEAYGRHHLDMILELRDGLPDLAHIISINRQAAGVLDWSKLDGEWQQTAVAPDQPAAILTTLGSSGQPRGAVHRHNSLCHNAADIAAILGCTADDVFLGAVPFSNTFGLTATILTATIAGGRLVCLPKFHPAQALRLIKQQGVTIFNGVPTMFAMALNHADFDPRKTASLRSGIMAGAHCPPSLAQRVREEMGCNVSLAYGLTEAAPSVTMTRLDDGPITAVETVGRPLPGIELKVIDDEGNALPPGAEGELCVRGYNVMPGYWRQPEATAQVLDSDGWLRTDDLAVIDANGPVRIVGRKDDVINKGGLKIYPGMVEMALRLYPGVAETAVVGVPDMLYGELAFACVVRRPGADFSEHDLLDFAGERLADYAVPDRVLFFDALPRRHNGLVNKGYLRDRVRIHGRAWKFGKNIDTDAIIPARRCNTADPRELAQYCMEDADPQFVHKMTRGDLIVADTNFGCGSSREVAPVTIKAAGVSAVIAKSFARIFFRNAINIGLPILECPEAVDGIGEGDEVVVEPAAGAIRNLTTGQSYQAVPFPDFLQRIIDQGGLLAYVEERLAQEAA